jgi:integrase
MSRKTTPLTNTQVKQAKTKDKEYNLTDGDGLMLRIKPNGTKLWLFNFYRPFTKKRVSISFGSYPDVSLAQARTKRISARELLAQDIDPQVNRDTQEIEQKKRLANTLSSVAKDWYTIKASKVTPATGQRIWNSIENHLLPDLGQVPISELTAPATIDILKPISKKGSLELVRRLCQRLNEIMNYAVNVGLINANPLVGIKAAFDMPTSKHMPTLKPEELPELMKALSYASIKIVTRCLIEWQLHTMTRPSESAMAKWEEIDFENKLWVIPAEKMKMKREHKVPLTDQTLYLLERLKPISGQRDYIFPANNNPKKHTNTETANMALKRMGFKGRLVSHGLRALASSTLNEQGFDSDIIESALAHVDKNDVRRAYNHAEYLERRRAMMNWWSNFIQEVT